MKTRLSLVALLFAVLLLPTSSAATTIHVPADQPQIQVALLACAPGDTVVVSAGTYVENIVWPNTHGLYLVSESGPGVTILDGSNPSHPDTGSVVVFSHGLDPTTVLEGFTITNGTGTLWTDPSGNGYVGGGILCDNASPSLIGNTIISNHTEYGGGIECQFSSAAIIRGNTIEGNTATGGSLGSVGGGIECFIGSSATITLNTVRDNASGWGGGIRVGRNSHPAIINNDIIGNTALNNGGGIQTAYSSGPTIHDNRIAENVANRGGGVACWGPDPTSEGARSSNLGRDGAYEGDQGKLPLDPFLSANDISANIGGGVMFNSETGLTFSPTIEYCFVGNNTGTVWGIGILCDYWTTPTIENCVIKENSGDAILCETNANPVIHFNDISGHAPYYGVRNVSPAVTVNAENNWWGDWTGPYHPLTNPNGFGDRVSDRVDYDPWLTTADIVLVDQPVPSGFVLRQNYPNPFNPRTTIAYSLPRSGRVTLRVYNVLGQQVATLVNGLKDAGTHAASWHATGVASGIYLYRIEVDGWTATRTMILAR